MRRKDVRFGIVGMGNAGMLHAKVLGEIKGARLSAVCASAERLGELSLPEDVARFESYEAMLASGSCDAVAVATPHPSHPALAKAALDAGLHVFCEKPAGVDMISAREMNEAAERSGALFTMNFNRRLEPVFLKLKSLIDSGETGRIRRISWVGTDWFRSDGYYSSAQWRGTWGGEGGGVMLNQCIHLLDLWQWIFKMPTRLRGFCKFGKYHDIEVEDEVTAFLEGEGDLTGTIILSTGESPGTNRIEIACDHGRVTVQDRKIVFDRTCVPVSKFSRSSDGFGEPERWRCEIPVEGQTDLSSNVMRNFVAAIRGEEPLAVDGKDGLKSLALANAALLSTWTDSWVEFPFDEAQFKSLLDSKAKAMKPAKGSSSRRILDLAKSFK